jgi:selenocysteine lyase/cysteine desulfurase
VNLYPDENQRHTLFPVCANKVFMAHAAVTVLPRGVADAIQRSAEEGAQSHQENEQTWRDVKATRVVAAKLVNADADEIALLGPTALGLSLFANGLTWSEGDEVVCYPDDYPANVYPWLELERKGVVVKRLQPESPGEITPALVEGALTKRTRLVALASAHFFSGYRIDVDAIGQLVHSRGALFAVDAIQTLGAFPFDSTHVDFLAADSHKWLLGPNGIGIVMVKRAQFEHLRPTLLGAWNVHSPGFIAQEQIRFVPTAQRYEPGSLNLIGIAGMRAGLDLILGIGVERIAERLLELKSMLLRHLDDLGFEVIGPRGAPTAHAITTAAHPRVDAAHLHRALTEANIVCSLRRDRAGRAYLRFSPHFYNTEAEIDRVAKTLRENLEPGR